MAINYCKNSALCELFYKTPLLYSFSLHFNLLLQMTFVKFLNIPQWDSCGYYSTSAIKKTISSVS